MKLQTDVYPLLVCKRLREPLLLLVITLFRFRAIKGFMFFPLNFGNLNQPELDRVPKTSKFSEWSAELNIDSRDK